MNCEEAWNLISARMDGEISPEDRPALDAHLAGCATCRSVSDGFEVDDSRLRRAFVGRRRAAAAVADDTIARMRASRRRFPARSALRTIAAAAAGFAAAVLIFRPFDTPEGDRVVVSGPRPELPAPVAPAGPAAPRPDSTIPLGRLALVAGAMPGSSPGAVEIRDGERWRALGNDEPLGDGARVRTPAATYCEIRLADGSEVRLHEGTEVVLPSRRRVELVSGRVWSSVEAGPVPFEVRSPEGSVTALGTKFDVRHEGEETHVTVVEGLTRVSAGKDEEFVRPGETARIHNGVVEKRKADVLLATNWVHRLLAMKSEEDNPEVVRRLDDLLASIGEAKLGKLYEEEIKALGESCVRPLLSYLESMRSCQNPALRLKAGAILADIAPAWAVKELIHLLADEDRAIRGHAARALERLTGETLGRSPDDWERESWQEMRATYDRWQAWWVKNAGRYEAPARHTTK